RRLVALTATEIAKVTGELAPALAGGWIQKVHQPTDHTLVLEIRAPGRTHRLLISCQREAARLHLTTETFQNPPTPPPFCQFLRAHLQGARIDQFEQIQGDRIVQLALTAQAGKLRKSIKKLRRRIEAWHEDLAEAEKYKAYARYGELIKANLGTIRKGQTDVTLVDYFDEELPSLTIPLDQAKTPQGNMDD